MEDTPEQEPAAPTAQASPGDLYPLSPGTLGVGPESDSLNGPRPVGLRLPNASAL